jgi:hypothetical protein
MTPGGGGSGGGAGGGGGSDELRLYALLRNIIFLQFRVCCVAFAVVFISFCVVSAVLLLLLLLRFCCVTVDELSPKSQHAQHDGGTIAPWRSSSCSCSCSGGGGDVESLRLVGVFL